MLHILWSIIVGAIIGVIAKFVHPGKENMGMLLTIALGIGGSLLATFLGQVFGFYKEGQSAGLIGGVLGAVLLLAIYGFITNKTTNVQS